MLFLILLLAIASLFYTNFTLFQRVIGTDNLLVYPFTIASGISIAGYCYYLSLLLWIPYWILLVFLIMPGAVSAAKHYVKKQMHLLPDPGYFRLLMMAIAALVLTTGFNRYIYRWGDWDAWAIWNLHAKFLFYPEHWTNMFTTEQAPTHPDYPLMLPSLIAFVWRGLEKITPLVPVAIAQLLLLAVPLTVFLALNRFGKLFSAAIALAIFALDTRFINLAGAQYADTLLAFFILITFVAYKEAAIGENKGWLPLLILGFFAGSATWIKNEGLLFFAAFSFAFLIQNIRKPMLVFCYGIGTLAPVLILIHFKLILAPPNDVVHADRGAVLAEVITDPARYWLIIKHLTLTAFQYYWMLILLVAILLVNKIAFVRRLPFAVLALVLVGYFTVYLITPHNLRWHLEASADRLFHHIYPASVYLILSKLSAASDLGFLGNFKFRMPDFRSRV